MADAARPQRVCVTAAGRSFAPARRRDDRFRLRADRARDRRDVQAKSSHTSSPRFAGIDEAHPDCGGADEAFATIRAIGFLGRHLELLRKYPDQIGPNVKANIEEGLSYSAEDVARALTLQTLLYRRWHEFFGRYDIVLAPAVTISPRPWRELYPAEIDGKSTKSYFHWLALAYAVTLAGHPALSLPVGLDRNGMPFGLQIIGPRGGDLLVLSVAAALESLLASDAATARPRPDIARLKRAAPIAGMVGFRAFD